MTNLLADGQTERQTDGTPIASRYKDKASRSRRAGGRGVTDRRASVCHAQTASCPHAGLACDSCVGAATPPKH